MREREGSWRVRFSGLNVVYNKEGYHYLVDIEGQFYVSLDAQTISETEEMENVRKETKS